FIPAPFHLFINEAARGPSPVIVLSQGEIRFLHLLLIERSVRHWHELNRPCSQILQSLKSSHKVIIRREPRSPHCQPNTLWCVQEFLEVSAHYMPRWVSLPVYALLIVFWPSV